jgi:hypothetical protein
LQVRANVRAEAVLTLASDEKRAPPPLPEKAAVTAEHQSGAEPDAPTLGLMISAGQKPLPGLSATWLD